MLKRIVETLKNILLIFLISMIAQWANVKLSVNAEPLHQMNNRNIEPSGFNHVRQSSAFDPFFELPPENQSWRNEVMGLEERQKRILQGIKLRLMPKTPKHLSELINIFSDFTNHL